MKLKIYLFISVIFFISAAKIYPQITLLTPTINDTIVPGEQYNISWTNNIVAPVDIAYQTAHGEPWIEIAQNIQGTNYNWNVPDLIPGNIKILVSNKSVSTPQLIWGKPDAHDDEIRSVQLSQNGKYLLTTGRDNKIAIWDINSKSLLSAKVIKYIQSIYCARFFNNDRNVLIAGDSTFISWNLQQGTLELYLNSDFTGLVRTCDVNPDSKIAALGTSRGEVILYSLENKQAFKVIKGEPGDEIYTLRFSHDGSKLIFAGFKGIIYSANWASDDPIQEFKGHGDQNGQSKLIWDLDFSYDDSKFVSGGVDGTVRLWDYSQSTPVQTFLNDASGLNHVRGVRYAHSGSFILSGALDSTLRQWNIAEGVEKTHLRINHGGGILCIDMNRGGDTLVSAGRDNSFKIWKNAEVTPYSDTVECAVKHRLVFSLTAVDETVGNESSAELHLDYRSPFADSTGLKDIEAKIIYPSDMLEITNSENPVAQYQIDTASILMKSYLKTGNIGTIETRALQSGNKTGDIYLKDVVFDVRSDYKIESKAATVSLSELCPGLYSRNVSFTESQNSIQLQQLVNGSNLIVNLNLITNSAYKFKIFDINSKCLYNEVINPTQVGNRELNIDISGLPTGLYLATLYWENRKISAKFIKQ